jgi:hypothetical protein
MKPKQNKNKDTAVGVWLAAVDGARCITDPMLKRDKNGTENPNEMIVIHETAENIERYWKIVQESRKQQNTQINSKRKLILPKEKLHV